MKRKFHIDGGAIALGCLFLILLCCIAMLTTELVRTINGTNGGDRLMAKVRYFDGSIDTVPVERYWINNGGMVKVLTRDGFELTGNSQNIILIREPEGWDQ